MKAHVGNIVLLFYLEVCYYPLIFIIIIYD